MTRARIVIALACLAAPATAQQGASEFEVEGRSLINRWIAAYNKGDVDAIAADVYATPDKAALAEIFASLRTDSFGKLDVYTSEFCSRDSAHGRAIVKFARIYTFGGKMNDDEAKLFDLEKTSAGWRITGESDAGYSAVLACS